MEKIKSSTTKWREDAHTLDPDRQFQRHPDSQSPAEASGLESEVELELQGRSLILKAPENPRMDWEAAFAKESLGPPSEEEREWEALSNQFDEDEWQWE